MVVITDRRVLDKQLQETISQFEHKTGVVQVISENSAQLAKALNDGAPIVVTSNPDRPALAGGPYAGLL